MESSSTILPGVICYPEIVSYAAVLASAAILRSFDKTLKWIVEGHEEEILRVIAE